MREYTMVFKEGLSVGLRKSEKTQMNSQSLTLADGALHDNGTLVNLPDLQTINLSVLGCTFPFPQVFKLRDFVLVCTETSIYTYDGSLNLVYVTDGGSSWTVADYYTFLVLSNGNVVVILSPESGEWTDVTETDLDIPNCLCVCELNGQLIIGGPGVSMSSGY